MQDLSLALRGTKDQDQDQQQKLVKYVDGEDTIWLTEDEEIKMLNDIDILEDILKLDNPNLKKIRKLADAAANKNLKEPIKQRKKDGKMQDLNVVKQA